MTARLELIAHGATAATRAARFPDDEPLEASAIAMAQALRLRRYERVLTSPARAARETVAALRLEATVDPGLCDCDYGRWRGIATADVAASEPDDFARWLNDPEVAAHGGETLAGLIARVGVFLSQASTWRGATLGVTHASVIRAAVVTALGAGPSAFWRIDAAPLSIVELSGREGRWNLVALGPRAAPS